MAVGVSGFPAAKDTLTELIRAVNNGQTTIGAGGAANSATTITVTSAADAPADGKAIIVDAADATIFEIITFTGKTSTTLTGCTRGVESSGAKTWSAGALVYFDGISALNHNVLASAIVAMQAAMGRVLISSQAFTTQSAFSLNNVFTSLFENYELDITIPSRSASSNTLLRLRASGTDASGASDYSWTGELVSQSAITRNSDNADSSILLTTWSAATPSDQAIRARIFRPQVADNTIAHSHWAHIESAGAIGGWFVGGRLATTQFDGFTLLPDTGTITGRVTVYGCIQ